MDCSGGVAPVAPYAIIEVQEVIALVDSSVHAHVARELIVGAHRPRRASRVVLCDRERAIADSHNVVVDRERVVIQILIRAIANAVSGILIFKAYGGVQQQLIDAP